MSAAWFTHLVFGGSYHSMLRFSCSEVIFDPEQGRNLASLPPLGRESRWSSRSFTEISCLPDKPQNPLDSPVPQGEVRPGIEGWR